MSEQKTIILKEFGAYLRALRKAKKWSLREVEARSGIPYTNLGQIERGQRDAAASTLIKLSEAYEKDIIISYKRE